MMKHLRMMKMRTPWDLVFGDETLSKELEGSKEEMHL
jgi:hypothetical protein